MGGLLPHLHVTLDAYIAAAQLFRFLRARGVTVRGAVDCVISQTCLDHDAELLSSDVAFLRISEHTSLRLCGV